MKAKKQNITLVQNDITAEIYNELKQSKSLAIDTETMGLNPLRDRLCLIQISIGDDKAILVQFNNDALSNKQESLYDAPNLKKLLNDPAIMKIFHFARFDLAVIEQYLCIRLQNIFCTKVASKLTRTYDNHHGLKVLCRELLDINLSKQQQSSNWGAKILSEDQQLYAASDVLYLHKIYNILHKILINNDRLKLAESIFEFLPFRAKLDLLGWCDEDILAH